MSGGGGRVLSWTRHTFTTATRAGGRCCKSIGSVQTLTAPAARRWRDNGRVAGAAPVPSVRRHRSLYFRIGFSFVAFVAGLLALQSLFFTVVLSRPPLRGSPNTVVALVAADLTAALTEDRRLDIDVHLKRQYGNPSRSMP